MCRGKDGGPLRCIPGASTGCQRSVTHLRQLAFFKRSATRRHPCARRRGTVYSHRVVGAGKQCESGPEHDADIRVQTAEKLRLLRRVSGPPGRLSLASLHHACRQWQVECPRREVALLPLSLCSSAVSLPGRESLTHRHPPSGQALRTSPTVQPQHLSGDTWLVNSRGHVMA